MTMDETLTMTEESIIFHEKELPTSAFHMLENIRRHGKLCDVTLKVGEQKLTAHRIVLAATIPYFNAMFTHDMLESQQNEIDMHGVESGAMTALVNFAYNGQISINIDNVQSLFVASNYLHMQTVKEACCQFLKQRLHPYNVLGIRSFADRYVCSSLLTASNIFIQKHFQLIVQHESFLKLPFEDVVEILKQDQLHIRSEEQVFQAIISWIKYDEELRKEHLPSLLVCVRLPLLTPQFLSDSVAVEGLIKNCLRCRDLLDEARDYHLMPERRHIFQTFSIRERCCPHMAGHIYIIGGLNAHGESVRTVERFEHQSNTWSIVTPLNVCRSRVGAAVLRGCLYAIGGCNGKERLNTVEMYNPKEGTWKSVTSMKYRRSALCVSVLDNFIYVCGGYDGNESLSTMEVYDPDLNSWTMRPSMENRRSASGMAVLDGEIYMCGGHDGHSLYDSVECYNTASSRWRPIPPMKSKRCRLGVATINHQLYVAGGYDGTIFLRSVEAFNPTTCEWTTISLMHVKRSRVALTAMAGSLYAVGGYDGVCNLRSVEVYSPEENKWVLLEDMRAHEGGVGVAVIPFESSINDEIFNFSFQRLNLS